MLFYRRAGNKVPFLILLLLVLLCAACAVKTKKPEQPVWSKQNALVKSSSFIPLDNGEASTLIAAIDQSLKYLGRLNKSHVFNFGAEEIELRRVKETLLDLREKTETMGLTQDLFEYINSNYDFYSSAAPEVLFTGYFEASLFGSLNRNNRYNYPLYGVPQDLIRVELKQFLDPEKFSGLPSFFRGKLVDGNSLVPYYSRGEIDFEHKLDGQDLELVWVDDPFAAFFLHIQGSGIVYLDNGDKLRVNFADTNGHPYRALGRVLIEENILSREQVSMQSILAYLKDNPQRMQELLSYNPSYVFFRLVEEGPIGSINVPLTPLRSIATDYRLFPRGALAYVKTEFPLYDEVGNIIAKKEFSGFVLNQDTGGAIRGAARVDLFTGHGDQAELLAGPLKDRGHLLFLLKRED